jgi:polyisoprenoid-binding protein YceI
MKPFFLIASLFLLPVSGAFAEGSTARQIDLSKENANVEFLAMVKPGSIRINGAGAKVTGTLSVLEKSLTGALLVHLEELKTGIGLRDQHMKEKFLETKKFPDAKLIISEMNLPNNPFVVSAKLTGVPFKGLLSVHGVESKVDGTADIDSTGSEVVAEVKTKTTIAAHQIEKPSYLGVKVADDIDVLAHLKLKK